MGGKGLNKVCDSLFYGKGSLAGKIGIKVLGDVVGASEKEFEEYLTSLEQEETQTK